MLDSKEYLRGNVVWEKTEDPIFPYSAIVDGKRLQLRVNDFPEEPLYTLIVDGVEVVSFDDFPKNWSRPE